MKNLSLTSICNVGAPCDVVAGAHAEQIRGYVTVTRKLSLKTETKSIFCDWISMYQDFPHPIPIFHSGQFLSIDSSGNIEFITDKSIIIEGSSSSKVSIGSDGYRLKFSGNISRFCRSDNVFGFQFSTCIELINTLLDCLGLPPFTNGKFFLNSSGKFQSTGAKITRIDITCNYETGSQSNANSVLSALSRYQLARVKTGVFSTTTVDYGRGSKWFYHKVYNKFEQSKKHKEISKQVLDYLQENGIIRHECTLKSRYLARASINYLSLLTDEIIMKIYTNKANEVFERNSFTDFSTCPPSSLKIYSLWVSGMLSVATLSRASFYRHRKILLEYGFDISVPFSDNIVHELCLKRFSIVRALPPSDYDFQLAA
ncbi:MAG: phage/plasmid replication protein [Cyclobacteriaceae bacterium]|nr:phage/plasmid replication protein [Cyclobacteriaceae bacterium]